MFDPFRLTKIFLFFLYLWQIEERLLISKCPRDLLIDLDVTRDGPPEEQGPYSWLSHFAESFLKCKRYIALCLRLRPGNLKDGSHTKQGAEYLTTMYPIHDFRTANKTGL